MVKKGFSLAEALVVMAIISIFFAAASKIITTRPKPPKQVNQHGYYECYLNVYQTINAAGQQVTVSRPTQRYVRNNVPLNRQMELHSIISIHTARYSTQVLNLILKIQYKLHSQTQV